MSKLLDEQFMSELLRKKSERLYESALLLMFIWKCISCKDPIFPECYTDENRKEIIDGAVDAFEEAVADFFKNDESLPTDSTDPQVNFAVNFLVDYVFFYEDDDFKEKYGIQLENPKSFIILYIEQRMLSRLWGDFFIIQDLLGVESKSLFSILDEMTEDLTRWSSELTGFWMSKSESIMESRPGSRTKTVEKTERIERIKTQLGESGKLNRRGLEISKNKFSEFVSGILGVL